MTDAVLDQPVRDDADIERLLLSRVRDDPRPYSARESFAGTAVRALLKRVGNPQSQLRCVHIAGSKGKGSVALMSEHLLHHAGHRTGTFTSPHLQRWNERIRVAASDIDSASLAQALDTLRPHLAALDQESDQLSPSFFDVLTASALLIFAQNNCDAVVLETGLGGRFDATNIVTPLATCITSIELEHTDKLGKDLLSIAHHKAGIIKRGIPVATARYDDDAQRVISDTAKALDAVEWRLGRNWRLHRDTPKPGSQSVHYERLAGESMNAESVQFTLAHNAGHMAVNAGLALTMLATAGWPVDATALSDCVLPARAQVLREQPLVIVDSAHTPASLAAFGDSLRAWPDRQRRFVVAASRGKSIRALAELTRTAHSVWVTCADATRSAPADEVAATLRAHWGNSPREPALHVVDDPAQAFQQADNKLPTESMLCVCGSVYLAGVALRWWHNKSPSSPA